MGYCLFGYFAYYNGEACYGGEAQHATLYDRCEVLDKEGLKISVVIPAPFVKYYLLYILKCEQYDAYLVLLVNFFFF